VVVALTRCCVSYPLQLAAAATAQDPPLPLMLVLATRPIAAYLDVVVRTVPGASVTTRVACCGVVGARRRMRRVQYCLQRDSTRSLQCQLWTWFDCRASPLWFVVVVCLGCCVRVVAWRCADAVMASCLLRTVLQDSEQLMKSSLKWSGSVDSELLKLVEDKAQGNPLMVKEVRRCQWCRCLVPQAAQTPCARVAGAGRHHPRRQGEARHRPGA
jgi:hypothetical protein